MRKPTISTPIITLNLLLIPLIVKVLKEKTRVEDQQTFFVFFFRETQAAKRSEGIGEGGNDIRDISLICEET